MKSIFFALFIAGALSISLVSCKKESTSTDSTSTVSQYQPFTIDLVADHWVKTWVNTCNPTYSHYGECPSGHTAYINNLPLSTENLFFTIKVYLVLSDGQALQINGQEVMFMGSGLHATVSDYNIEIDYASNALTLPFSSLAIRVVGE